ncbi:exodeoxyribonuclease VII small subunit [Oculatella sp. FACHB-28]|uniref:exodeoxyribonuclease VII small subunit n=1 Tax=Cyanophyceae TaxID=3028117 RepID=UPI001689D56F|nr:MULTISPECIES: exodeoxyribonuclease VII small subunit [Cyanophyceae]MBD1865783.1 exodeoxyribonuclease VII small subunit [Cyanobacteria bacterium FACHB-471]MBD2058594.1 exodeoxyribonuclease VII small subunit [Oculatella sp. FACHB-28]MBD2066519.1 exodeoxyribonuclease VII small subunit [Leptolyngbya sp. FACHB-671]
MSDSTSPGTAYSKSSLSSKAIASDSQTAQSWSYEQTVAQIEAIITRIELGDLELADVFEQFATAVEHLRECEIFLSHQQRQMDVLVETLMDEPEGF